MNQPQPLQILARDGFALSALWFQSDSPKGVIQLCGGTGIKKEFYTHFANYLLESGYHVMLFDYRGIGGSRPKSLKGFEARNHEWGMKDMAAVLDWIDARYASLPKFLIGHSAGGQQLGFMDNHWKFRKALLISSSTGYWGWLASHYKYLTLLIWHIIVPVTNATIGYVPASSFGLGEDLPKGIANEWRSWCLSENYFGKFLGRTLNPTFFDQVKMPLHFLYPEDDTIATDRSVASLRNFYSSAPTTTEKILLKEHGLQKVGHLGFFSRKSKEKLWQKAITFLE